MDIKKNCLDIWKIPVLNYDPKQVLANANNSKLKQNEDRNRRSNKTITLQETAKLYENYDQYSDNLLKMVNMFAEPIPKAKSNPKLDEEEDLYTKIMGKSTPNPNKNNNLAFKSENRASSKNKNLSDQIFKSESELDNETLLNQKRAMLLNFNSNKSSNKKRKTTNNDTDNKKELAKQREQMIKESMKKRKEEGKIRN